MKRTHALTVSAAFAGLLTSLSHQAQAQQVGGTYSTNQGGSYTGYVPQQNDVDNIGAEDGQFVFGFDRVTSLAFDRQTMSYEGGFEHTFKSTSLNLLGVDSSSPAQMPRFALDYVIAAGVTAGVALSFATRSLSMDDGGGEPPLQPPTAQDEGSTFLIGGRVGYAYAIDETFGIWPRAGLSYAVSSGEYGVTDETTGVTETFDLTTSFFDLDLEALLVISPVEHTAFMIGPYLDLGLGGKFKAERPDQSDDSRNAKLTSFGLVVNAVGYY
jgi:hypothetical protein